jgi:membrane protein implicated in regulation of membrane protease activity
VYLLQIVTNTPTYTVWLLVGFLFLFLGLIVGEPTAASLGLAALITAIAAITVSSVTTQVILWGILSISLIVVLRGMVPRQSKDSQPSTQATVSETIPASGFGWVSYEGALWKARCQISDVSIAVGKTVHVVDRQGLTLIVLPIASPDSYLDTPKAD